MNDFDTSEDESEQFGRFCSGRKIMIAHHLSELAAYTAPARALANHKVAGAWRERTFRSGMRAIVKSMLLLRELFLQLDRIANLPGYSKKSECYVVMKLFNIRND